MKSTLNQWMQAYEISHFEVASFNGLIFYFKGTDLNTKSTNVSRFYETIQSHCALWVTELVPSYASCLVEYDAFASDHHQVLAKLTEMPNTIPDHSLNDRLVNQPSVHRIPVWYCVTQAQNDLGLVATEKNLSVDEIIKLHTKKEYKVYAVGFQPGFAYLGELAAELSMPRLAKPRVKVPRGAVAIADKQTAVYPNSSPGGWHILGLCPLDLRQKATAINAFKVGDSVRFEAIDAAQYEAILSSQNESKIG